MQKYLDFFAENDHFAHHCGFELIEAEEGYALARMKIQPFHLNGAGVVHGGAIFSLADFAFAAAANSGGQLSLAVAASASFINPAHAGTLLAEAKELGSSRKLGHYQVTISDENELLIARFQGTAYRKESKFGNGLQTQKPLV
jgi:acyl-CoA thioesterase